MDAENIWPREQLTPSERLMRAWRDDARTAVARQMPAQLQRLLKELSSEPDLARAEAQKLLTSAACYNFPPILDHLLSQPGVKADGKNKDGMTALHVAAGLGHAAICAELVRSGADVDCRSTDGTTPLMIACMRGAKATIKMLLETGASPVAVSNSGLTPMKAALHGAEPDCAVMILAYGGSRKRIQDVEIKSLPRSYAAARSGLTERLISLLNAGEPAFLPRYDKDVVQEALDAGFDETAAAAQAWRAKQLFGTLAMQIKQC